MEYLNNYFCGTVSGALAACVSHPFYNVKTELQNGKKLSEIIGKMKKDTFNNNRKFMYTGLSRMCVGLGMEKFLVFGTYTNIMLYFELDRYNFYHSLMAGFIAGAFGSLASCPSEQLAIDKLYGVKNYSINHLYKGLLPTMGRESVGFSIYFLAYSQFSKKYNQEKTMFKTIIGGTFSITTALVFFYPLDKIKTNIQSGIKINVNTFANIYQGVHFGLIRAIPFHVTCFVLFEHMMKQKIFC